MEFNSSNFQNEQLNNEENENIIYDNINKNKRDRTRTSQSYHYKNRKSHSLKRENFISYPNSKNNKTNHKELYTEPMEVSLFKLTETKDLLPTPPQNNIDEEKLIIMKSFISKFEECQTNKDQFLFIEKENEKLKQQIEDLNREKIHVEKLNEDKIKGFIEEVKSLKETIESLIEKEQELRNNLHETIIRNKEINELVRNKDEDLVKKDQQIFYLEHISLSLQETLKKAQEEFFNFLLTKGVLQKINSNDLNNI